MLYPVVEDDPGNPVKILKQDKQVRLRRQDTSNFSLMNWIFVTANSIYPRRDIIESAPHEAMGIWGKYQINIQLWKQRNLRGDVANAA